MSYCWHSTVDTSGARACVVWTCMTFLVMKYVLLRLAPTGRIWKCCKDNRTSAKYINALSEQPRGTSGRFHDGDVPMKGPTGSVQKYVKNAEGGTRSLQ